ncbi:MAG: ABC transporter permease [Ferruginibacter sp.]
MRKTLSILRNSLRLTFQELKVNKLRTALSLTGVAFGIFCIIGVLATVNSLEQNIQNELKTLGTSTVYIDKWDYSGGPDKPFWKLRARPVMKYENAAEVKARTSMAEEVSFLMQTAGNVSHQNDVVQNAMIYCITEGQIIIQPILFEDGRYFSASEFNNGSPVGIIGYVNAENLFGSSERAMGRQVEIKGKKVTIVGVIKKQGQNMIGWKYDECMMIPYTYARTIFDEKFTNPILIAKGKPEANTGIFIQELRGAMRQVRKLSPTDEDNFALNSVEAFSKAISASFVTINIVGSIIGGISLIVGMFGIANIMFVTVKERTSLIGLKKAIGAKKSTILFEFLTEAGILCLLGGIIGIIFVYILTLILSGPMHFPIYISLPMLGFTIVLCLIVGILAGIIPASQAAKMDPVVAIRS